MKVVGSLEGSPKRERSAEVSSFGASSHKSLVHHWIRCCQQGKVRRQVLVLFILGVRCGIFSSLT